MQNFILIMCLPLAACLILAGIHCYLGLHVLERQVIFVDLALAQMAALGSAAGIAAGLPPEGWQVYLFSLGAALSGAALFAWARPRMKHLPMEAVIGIFYAAAAALMIMLLSRSGEGDEHLREALIGNILLVTPGEVLKLALLYTGVGILHWKWRAQFLLISTNPEQAREQGVRVPFWDFLFYALFGIVVTSSVHIAGVLLVFSLLVMPASAAFVRASTTVGRLIWGWGLGAAGCLLGMIVSYSGDFPTAASVVTALTCLALTAIFVSPPAKIDRSN